MVAASYTSFLIRLWRLAQGQMRVRIEHIQSGEVVQVNSLEEATARAEQVTGNVPLAGRQYIRNRPPEGDEGTTGWRSSMYDHYRFRGFADAARVGPFPWYTRAQNDMLRAEGLIRTGEAAAALPLINRTRNLSGLPDVTAAGTQGHTDSVPRFPASVGTLPGLGALTHPNGCGTLALAMMWETWMETAWTSYGAWFFANRGWGVMPVGTAVHSAVPHQELNARQVTIYNTGGAGLPGGAGPSVFGFGEGGGGAGRGGAAPPGGGAPPTPQQPRPRCPCSQITTALSLNTAEPFRWGSHLLGSGSARCRPVCRGRRTVGVSRARRSGGATNRCTALQKSSVVATVMMVQVIR
jgi:hypothetical protein